MYGIELSEYDTRIYAERLEGFLPDRIIDVHTHIYKEDFITNPNAVGCVTWTNLVASECSAEDLLTTYSRLFPGKTVKPVLMGHPVADLHATNAYTRKCAEKYNAPSLFCTAFDTPTEEIYAALTEGGFAGIKPYINNAPDYIPPEELRIFDFLPQAHLEIADRLGTVVMLHIARARRLNDPVNIAQLMEIDRLYPNAKVIVAHIGRAYIEADLGGAFDTLKNSKNLLFDFSANTLDKAMEACIAAVGPERVLFGSDMPISKMRMYRIEEGGIYKNVVMRGMYGDVSGDKNMKETDETEITTFIYEELLAFRRAAEKLNLSRGNIENIFCGNAERIFL